MDTCKKGSHWVAQCLFLLFGKDKAVPQRVQTGDQNSFAQNCCLHSNKRMRDVMCDPLGQDWPVKASGLDWHTCQICFIFVLSNSCAHALAKNYKAWVEWMWCFFSFLAGTCIDLCVCVSVHIAGYVCVHSAYWPKVQGSQLVQYHKQVLTNAQFRGKSNLRHLSAIHARAWIAACWTLSSPFKAKSRTFWSPPDVRRWLHASATVEEINLRVRCRLA